MVFSQYIDKVEIYFEQSEREDVVKNYPIVCIREREQLEAYNSTCGIAKLFAMRNANGL